MGVAVRLDRLGTVQKDQGAGHFMCVMMRIIQGSSIAVNDVQPRERMVDLQESTYQKA